MVFVLVAAFEPELAAGGGPAERGEVGAKGSSKIVSVWARRVGICGTGWSTQKQRGVSLMQLITTTVKSISQRERSGGK